MTSSWTLSSFTFFRLMDWIHPDLARRIETTSLYISHFASDWDKEKLRSENEAMKKEDFEKGQLLGVVGLERDRLVVERNELQRALSRSEWSENNWREKEKRWSEELQRERTQLKELESRTEALIREKEAILNQNTHLQQLNDALKGQVGAQERQLKQFENHSTPPGGITDSGSPLANTLYHQLPSHLHPHLNHLFDQFQRSST